MKITSHSTIFAPSLNTKYLLFLGLEGWGKKVQNSKYHLEACLLKLMPCN